MIGSNNPYGHGGVMVDKLLGDAYEIVKKVYDSIDDVIAVGLALTSSDIGTPLLTQRAVTVEGTTGAAGATTTIDFPDVGTDPSKVISSSIRIEGLDGDYYFADSGYFTSKVSDSGLVLTLKNDAPMNVRNTIVKWFFVYEVD